MNFISPIKKKKLVFVSVLFVSLVLILVILSLFGVSFSAVSFDSQNENLILSIPSLSHPLGTDQLGRDLLARLIYGARLSFLVAVITALIAFFIGTLVGSIAALAGGKIDSFICRAIDVIYSIPDLLILSIIGLLLNRSTTGILFAIGFISWMDLARLTRAEILKLKQSEFILSAQAIGLGRTKTFLRHMLPNILSTILVSITFIMPRAIISESTLSFLGLGISPPNCSWGTLAGDGWQFLNTHTNLIFYPSLLIMLTVLSLNIIGDFLAELNQPKKSYI